MVWHVYNKGTCRPCVRWDASLIVHSLRHIASVSYIWGISINAAVWQTPPSL